MGAIKSTKDFLRREDGHEIFIWQIRPEKPKGWLLVVHGFGEHCGRYERLANYFAKDGWGVFLYDQRGHGRTPGLRAYVDRFQSFVDDLDFLVNYLHQEQKNTKVFLLAHSFGGQVAINYLAQHPDSINGAILSSPNVKLGFRLSFLKRVLGPLLSEIIPSFSVDSEINPEHISRDSKEVKVYLNDRLVQNKVTLRMGNEIIKNLDLIMELGEKIKVPCFLFHGGNDKITSPQATRDFFDTLKVKDKKLKIFEGYFHETMNDLGKEKVYREIHQWLNDHLSHDEK